MASWRDQEEQAKREEPQDNPHGHGDSVRCLTSGSEVSAWNEGEGGSILIVDRIDR